MIRLRFLALAWLVPSFATLSLAAACGGSTTTAQPKPDPTGVIDPDAGLVTLDAGPDGSLGPDPLDTTYPTKHTPIPQVEFNGVKVMKNPKIVTVTFDTNMMGTPDTMRASLEQFGDTILQSKWWDAVRDGFCDDKGNCIGQGSGGGHVALPSDAAALSYTDSAAGAPSTIQDFLKAHIADGSFPPPDADTLYAIYFPSRTSITLDNDSSCTSFGAYHNSVMVTPPPADDAGAAPAPVEVVYAIMPRCRNNLADVTVSASHELIEAATDPHVGGGYYMSNTIWNTRGGEVGDLCVSFSGNDTYLEGPFTVQRSWSNKAAAASHNPCVPAPSGPYFNVAPPSNTDAIALKVGATKVVPLTAFSDAAMDDWSLDAQEYTHFMGGNDVLTIAVDRTNVHNGSKPNLTVTLNARPTGGLAYFALVSTSGNSTHTWPMVVRPN
jgi:hypothetical protein